MTIFLIQSPVSTDVRDGSRFLLTEEVKETVERIAIRPVDRVNQSSAIVIDHHQEEAIATSIGDLVDADSPHTVEEFVVVEIRDDSRDDVSDGAPRATQKSSGGRRGHLDRTPRRQLLKSQGVARRVARPRNSCDHHTVLGATHPRNNRDDEYLCASEVQSSPSALSTRVITRAALLAVRASPSMRNPRAQMDLDGLINEINVLHADALGVDAQGPG